LFLTDDMAGYAGLRAEPQSELCVLRVLCVEKGIIPSAMKVLVDISIVPLGVGLSLSSYIAECEKIFAAAKLKTALHAYGTNVEGEWDEVFGAIRKCHETLHGMGAPRISTNLRLGTRTDRAQTMEDKVRSVTEKL
jgi:uncharacterized protein (TIGR00106 family)